MRPEGCPPSATELAIIRDDLLHPLWGGNKARKLDGLWAAQVVQVGACRLALESSHSCACSGPSRHNILSTSPSPTPLNKQATDVVTCGGLQSAHTLAVAAACAERGKRAHLLVRGERPAVPTGTHLYARLLAHRVEYVSRADYADREAMLAGYTRRLRQEQQQDAAAAAATPPQQQEQQAAGGNGSIAVIPEGAATPAALLGLIRLVAWLSGDAQSPLAGRRCHIVVDSGTGATAAGAEGGLCCTASPAAASVHAAAASCPSC